MGHDRIFRLKVDRIERNCRFELTWGQGQQIKIDAAYPATLTQSYQAWQRAYIRYYQTRIRGRIVDQGSLMPIDPHAHLVQSETKLLTELRTWLGSEPLSAIRKTLATAIKQWVQQDATQPIDLFLTCSPLELERLPWEAWELETEIASPVSIRLTRTPVSIRSNHVIPRDRYRKGGARILAIFGDRTGLDFQNDITALHSLSALAEIKMMAWQEDRSIEQHKTDICQGISDPKGWDILFFAGHSEENAAMGGELAIAPRTTISLREIEPYLRTAQAKGLQFALFNSCSGLSIANTLIDLGLNQVAIMREPIQNSVAQVFLVKFLQVLAQGKDVNDALRETCQLLKDSKSLVYPSAYLIPSLFGRPEAQFYKIAPFGWRAYGRRWRFNRQQAIALSSLALLSLLPPIQEFLLDRRTLIQAIYRELTHQIPQNPPPVLLVSIDRDSLDREKISQPNPLNRQYLAKIIDRLSLLDARGIGVDYLLDRPQGENDRILAQSIQNASKKGDTSFIFAAKREGTQEIGIIPDIASLNAVLQGSVTFSPIYLAVPENCAQICPFGYLIAVHHVLSTASVQLPPQGDRRTQILKALHQTDDPSLHLLRRVSIHPIAQIGEYFQQRWLQPIVDFSLPPETVYHTLPAWQLLNRRNPIEGQVVLIASGGYVEAGIDGGKDYFDPPSAIVFWNLAASKLTGGEAHAYMIHHWLTQHIVIPIPDLWLILVAVGIVKALETSAQSKRSMHLAISTNILYLLISLQAYITLKILLPWFLPSLAFWLTVLPALRKLSHER
jgi:CHASE2 domain-containing sensor protein